ncbi:unnamed protein product [Trichobilharzia regenti]|nr:unnamed protein product [Trichobilharzia regenti]
MANRQWVPNIQCYLKKDANLNENSFTWLQLIKTQLLSSRSNNHVDREIKQFEEIPFIGINQFSTVHVYKWDNQSLLLNNCNTPYIPLLNTSTELIQLGSALINHEFGLLIGPNNCGKQTTIRQLAFILGRRLIEFSNLPFNNNLKEFERQLKIDLLHCARIGGLLSMMNMHNAKCINSSKADRFSVQCGVTILCPESISIGFVM